MGQCQRSKEENPFPTFFTKLLLHSNKKLVEHFTAAKITLWSLSQGQRDFSPGIHQKLPLWLLSALTHYVGSKSEKVKLPRLKLFLSKIFPRIFDQTLGWRATMAISWYQILQCVKYYYLHLYLAQLCVKIFADLEKTDKR